MYMQKENRKNSPTVEIYELGVLVVNRAYVTTSDIMLV